MGILPTHPKFTLYDRREDKFLQSCTIKLLHQKHYTSCPVGSVEELCRDTTRGLPNISSNYPFNTTISEAN